MHGRSCCESFRQTVLQPSTISAAPLKICGTKSGRDINKVEATGLTPVALESGAMTFGEARLTLDCHKLFKAPMQEADFIDKEVLKTWYGEKGGLHDVYVVEIDNVYTK